MKKEILPSASSTARSTSPRRRMPCCRAAATRSVSESRCRRAAASRMAPSRITTTAVPLTSPRTPGEAPLHVGQRDGQQREDADRQHAPGDREVLLGHRLLDQVAHGDVEQQLEGAELAERGPADGAGHRPQEHEHDGGADDDLHGVAPLEAQGSRRVVRSTETRVSCRRRRPPAPRRRAGWTAGCRRRTRRRRCPPPARRRSGRGSSRPGSPRSARGGSPGSRTGRSSCPSPPG